MKIEMSREVASVAALGIVVAGIVKIVKMSAK
jgi:hypothetical protein